MPRYAAAPLELEPSLAAELSLDADASDAWLPDDALPLLAVEAVLRRIEVGFGLGIAPCHLARLVHRQGSILLAEVQQTVDSVLRRGGRHLDVGQEPDAGFVVMADPAGNELCVIEPGNSFLAGTGPLGEVTCDGSRDVGLFWSAALGWSLGWDENEETSIQSPAGGTRLSWGGPPVAPKHGRNRQRFDLVADDLTAEVDRLVGLGAARLSGIELADPDGNEFTVRAAEM